MLKETTASYDWNYRLLCCTQLQNNIAWPIVLLRKFCPSPVRLNSNPCQTVSDLIPTIISYRFSLNSHPRSYCFRLNSNNIIQFQTHSHSTSYSFRLNSNSIIQIQTQFPSPHLCILVQYDSQFQPSLYRIRFNSAHVTQFQTQIHFSQTVSDSVPLISYSFRLNSTHLKLFQIHFRSCHAVSHTMYSIDLQRHGRAK